MRATDGGIERRIAVDRVDDREDVRVGLGRERGPGVGVVVLDLQVDVGEYGLQVRGRGRRVGG